MLILTLISARPRSSLGYHITTCVLLVSVFRPSRNYSWFHPWHVHAWGPKKLLAIWPLTCSRLRPWGCRSTWIRHPMSSLEFPPRSSWRIVFLVWYVLSLHLNSASGSQIKMYKTHTHGHCWIFNCPTWFSSKVKTKRLWINTHVLCRNSSSLTFYWHSKNVSGPPLCPRWLTKRRTYHPSSVIYQLVGRQTSEMIQT